MLVEAVDAPKNNHQGIETISIVHSANTRLLQQALTSDNTLIEIPQLVTSMRSAADIVAQTVGVGLNGQGGLFQSYNIRGFSKARLKTEINGISIISDRRAGNSLSFIPASIVDSVYLQKGPNSTLYGTGAMGGVVSLSTLDAQQSQLKLSFSPQDNTTELSARYVDDEFDVAAVHRKAQQAKSANELTLNSQFEQNYLQFGFNQQYDDLTIKAFSALSQGSDIGKSSAQYPLQKISDYPIDNHWLSQIEVSNSEQWLVRLYHHNQDWKSQVKTIKQQAINRVNLTRYQSTTLGGFGTYLFDDFQFGVEWVGRQGITIKEQEFNGFNQLRWLNTSVDASEDNIGAFISHQWVNHQFTLKSGARFDSISLKQRQHTKNDQFTSFSLNAGYQFTAASSLEFQVANAFRFPSVSELFFSGNTPRGNTQGNESLVAEESMGYQLSINHQWNEHLNITAHSYFYQVGNYIERYRITPQLRSYKNTDDVTIKGAEVTFKWQLSSQWSSAVGAQVQSSKDSNNQQIDDAIPNAIKWHVNWSNDPFSFNNHVSYNAKRRHAGPSEQPLDSNIIWNSSLAFQLTEELNIKLALYNITNELYYGSADEDAAYQPQRSINLTLQWML